MIDGMAHSAVVDYLDFYLSGWHWPAFNLADFAIVLGVLLLLLETSEELLQKREDLKRS